MNTEGGGSSFQALFGDQQRVPEAPVRYINDHGFRNQFTFPVQNSVDGIISFSNPC